MEELSQGLHKLCTATLASLSNNSKKNLGGVGDGDDNSTEDDDFSLGSDLDVQHWQSCLRSCIGQFQEGSIWECADFMANLDTVKTTLRRYS